MATRWAANVLQHCMGLRPGERVLALVDESLRPAGEALRAAATALGAGASSIRLLPVRNGILTVVPESLLRQVREADVIVSLIASVSLQHEPAALRAAMAAFRSAGRGRWAFGAHMSPDMLETMLTADFADVARRTAAMADGLTGVDHVRIVTAAGTDLAFRIGGRPICQDAGMLITPGALGNLPPGEVYVAPLEDSAEGRLVVDLCMGDIRVEAPVTLEFRRGQAVMVQGGPEADELRSRLGLDPGAWTMGEFGIGVNPFVRPCGRAIIDEKALGTIHIALGGNRSFGGANDAASHYDCVINSPQIYLDGAPL